MWKRVELFGWAGHIPNWQSVSLGAQFERDSSCELFVGIVHLTPSLTAEKSLKISSPIRENIGKFCTQRCDNAQIRQ